MFSGELFDVLDETVKKKTINVSKKVKVQEINHKRLIDVGDDENDEDSKKFKADVVDSMKSASEELPKFVVHHLHTSESCLHEVAVPYGLVYTPLSTDPSKPPAKEYSFMLDPFQKEAISCLENNQSVLVSAHTSAGKTVVAEYAVALSLKARQRVIYTTPIKALSNQKYRELLAEFVDVGLMTGDVTINPTASCLVMTTEILRSMLYRGSEVMREAAWVVFDEIHYMRDKERGVVWEESIILLPGNVHYVFLSATIPNALQFAEWIAHVHKQPCHVVYTEYRPTPLQHYIYPSGGDGIHLVLDENRSFKEDNFNTAMSVLRSAGDAGKGDQRGRRGGVVGESNVFKIVRMVMERNLAPVIIFSFSKRECEDHARVLCKLDFNDDEKKKLVHEVFNNALLTLSEEDRKLPKLQEMLPMLERGIGVHHSGLLPLTKEIIEILFSAGLIKVLCATETFSMGLNMPARTVLFTSAQKFDGKEFRWISSGEYIQMSGRAGRRGLDDKGIVILMLDEKISPGVAKQVLKGKPDQLNSSFHLTYTMIVNMLRVEGIEPDVMLEKSFLQFQNYSLLPDLISSLQHKQQQAATLLVPPEVSNYCRLRQQLKQATALTLPYLQTPRYLLPFLKPGRLVKPKWKGVLFDWAIVLQTKKVNNKWHKQEHLLEVLLHTDSHKHDEPPPSKEGGRLTVVALKLSAVQALSSVRLKMLPNATSHDSKHALLSMLKAVKDKFAKEVPLLDPVDDMSIKETAFLSVWQRTCELKKRLEEHEVHSRSDVQELVQQYEDKQKLEEELRGVRQELRLKRSLLQMEQLRRMKRVLRRLAYTSAADVVQIKGRVACEISSADVLVLSELLFKGTFSKLSATEVCALVSCFTFHEKATCNAKLDQQLTAAFKQLKEVAQEVGRVAGEVGLELDEQEYVDSFQAHLMPVVQAWCHGASFVHICSMTSAFEGSIIRSIRRLEECLRQMCQAAKVMGNADLEIKFAEGIRLIKRNIVFAASLYL